MTTESPEGAPRIEDELHRQRRVAESFGSDPERYDRARPRYPEAMVERILAEGPGADVLDVGCGTGIVARQFQAAGCAVLGVEPDPRMAEWAGRDGLEIEIATFEDWDPAGRTFDVLVSGQSWHWVDAVAGAAKAAAALRPGGRLAVFWNVERPPAELTAAFSAVYGRVRPDSLAARLWSPAALDGYLGLCTKAADGIGRADAFDEPRHWRFEWEHAYSREAWLDQLPTHGDHNQFAPAELAELLAGIGAAIDAAGGGFTMRYTTVAVVATRAGGV